MVQKGHLKAPGNWINDPNGFIYYKGKYHLFYQHFPYGPCWGTMHWGHAVSDDLVEWEHKGIALFPSQYGDQNGCFSGSAVENEGKMVLCYTGVHYFEADPQNIHLCLNDRFESCQMMISSEDGLHFDNFGGKMVVVPPIEDKSIGDRTHTRDPKIWKGKDGWYLVMGSRSPEGRGKLLFYRSDDLRNWHFVDDVSKGDGWGWMWECPDYFETKGGQVLVFSPMRFLQDGKWEENQAICMVVDFQEEGCKMKLPDNYQYLDYGLDLYAPQSTIDAQGRRVLIAWLRMPETVTEGPNGPWNGMFCLPRVVEVKNSHIYFRVHPQVRLRYSQPVETADVQGVKQEESQKAKKSPNTAGEPGTGHGEGREENGEIEMKTDKLAGGGYRICLNLEDGGCLDIGGYRINRRGNRICTDRTKVFCEGENYRTQFETPVVKEGNRLEVYVDEHMIEVYVNDGEYVISSTVYGLGRKIRSWGGTELVCYCYADGV